MMCIVKAEMDRALKTGSITLINIFIFNVELLSGPFCCMPAF